MKIPPTKKEPKKREVSKFESTSKLDEAVSRFNAATEQIGEILVERTDEISAIRLALAAKEHVMLEGKSGVAKSKLSKELFKRIINASTFSKQLTSTTQPDEVFGPMNSKKYREEAIWEYNTKGMMPESELVFLDEVYRAAKAFLSNLFSVMNEREFYNGSKLVKCPLITVIGTTNFQTNDDELDAFHDRWLVKAHVKPLEKPDSRIKMLSRFLSPESAELATFSLADLKEIHQGINRVNISDEMLGTFEELVRQFSKQVPHLYISDRRLVQALNLARVEYVLDEERKEFNEEYFAAAMYGVATIGNTEHVQPFQEIFTRLIGEQMKAKRFGSKLDKIFQKVIDLESDYDENMPKNEAVSIYQDIFRVHHALERAAFVDLGSNQANMDKRTQILRKSGSLLASLEKSVSKHIVREMESEEEES